MRKTNQFCSFFFCKSVILFFFFLHSDLFGFQKLQHIPNKDTWRDLSFRVGMGNNFQAEYSVDFFKSIWMANGSTHLSVFCKAGSEFEGFPDERSRSNLR